MKQWFWKLFKVRMITAIVFYGLELQIEKINMKTARTKMRICLCILVNLLILAWIFYVCIFVYICFFIYACICFLLYTRIVYSYEYLCCFWTFAFFSWGRHLYICTFVYVWLFVYLAYMCV
jgi:hypothetical protein